eukprot:4366563-Pyramimonas_sp.AAC.1
MSPSSLTGVLAGTLPSLAYCTLTPLFRSVSAEARTRRLQLPNNPSSWAALRAAAQALVRGAFVAKQHPPLLRPEVIRNDEVEPVIRYDEGAGELILSVWGDVGCGAQVWMDDGERFAIVTGRAIVDDGSDEREILVEGWGDDSNTSSAPLVSADQV